MKILLSVVALVVAGLTANAQRFTMPMGLEAVKAYVASNITEVGMTIRPRGVTNSDDQRYIIGPAGEYYSTEKGDLTAFLETVVADRSVNRLKRWASEKIPKQPLEYYLRGVEYYAKFTVSGYESNRFTTRCTFETKPFVFIENSDGTWSAPADALKIDESRFYGAEFTGSPNSVLAFKTVDQVKWVEYQTQLFYERDGVPETSSPFSEGSENGWPQGCWALKPIAEGGLLGNGYSYVYAGWLSGDRLMEDFMELYAQSQSGGFPFNPINRTKRVLFWYDEARTWGDEWTVTASLDGLTYGWRQIGHEPSVISLTSEGQMEVTMKGLEPGMDYSVFSVMSLGDLTLTSKSTYGVFKADMDGRFTFVRPFNPELDSEFYIVRPYAGEQISVTKTAAP